MYVIDGIAYPKIKKELLKVVEVKTLPEYNLWIKFNNGEIRLFDFSSLLDKPAFVPLNDKTLFNAVSLDHGLPVWQNGDIDISPEYLYENGKTA